MRWWQEYIFDNSEEAVYHIMQAANWAGQAICITQTTAPHAFSYKITSLYGLPHGHAVAVCLPEIWEYMLEHLDNCIDPRGQEYLQTIFCNIAEAMACNTPLAALRDFRQMLQQMEMPSPSSTNRESDIKCLSESVNPIRLKNNPVQLDTPVIVNLYSNILKITGTVLKSQGRFFA